MSARRHTPEEIVAKLRQMNALTRQGGPAIEAIRTIGVSEVTYYRWKRKFDGLSSIQVQRMMDLEAENARLRRALTDLTLDKLVVAEVERGIF